jgi:hypothetical protein
MSEVVKGSHRAIRRLRRQPGIAFSLSLWGGHSLLNSDLIGYEFEGEDGTLHVTGTPEWCPPGYVAVENVDGSLRTCRVAATLRRQRELTPEEEDEWQE